MEAAEQKLCQGVKRKGASAVEHVYCLFSMPHKQRSITDMAPLVFPCKAMNPTIIRRKWTQGKNREVGYPLLPGYIFLFSDQAMDAARLLKIEGVIKVLRYADGSYALTEEDERLARWLLKHDGTIGVSRAIREGDHIRVAAGPLKDYEGFITRVNKQRRRAQIEFRFDQTVWSAWMDFDWVE